MREIYYILMVSLDGFIEGPNGELGWSEPSEELHQHFNDLYATGEIDTSLYGRRLYELMAGYWPTINESSQVPDVELEFARLWKKHPKIVFSTTLDKVNWNAELKRSVDPEEIRALKKEPGTNMDVGGANLAASFMRYGLIDEFRLYVHPVILGGGTPMFPRDVKLKFKCVETRTFDGDVVMLRYRLAETV